MDDPRRAHPYGRSADDVRRRAQRTWRTRRLRITQLVVFSLLAVVLIGVGAYAIGELRDPVAEPGVIEPKTFGAAPSELNCPEPEAVPLEPGEVSVRVLNGTTRSGLAGEASGLLAERGYAIEDVGNTDQASEAVTIVHGPEGYLAAQSVRVQVSGAELQMDQREGTGVDLLLGEGYSGLEEEETATAALSEPVEVPEGC